MFLTGKYLISSVFVMICWDPASITFHLIYREGGGRREGEGGGVMKKQWGGQRGVSELSGDQINRDIFIIQ